MTYTYYVCYTIQIGNSFNIQGNCLDLPQKINSAVVVKGIEKFLLKNIPNANSVCILNWKFVCEEQNENQGEILNG